MYRHVSFFFSIVVSSEDSSSGVRESLLTPNEGPSLETSIFPFIVQGSERTFTFRVLFECLMLISVRPMDEWT